MASRRSNSCCSCVVGPGYQPYGVSAIHRHLDEKSTAAVVVDVKRRPSSGVRIGGLGHWWHLLDLGRLVVGMRSVVEELHVGKVDMLWEVAEGSFGGIAGFGNILLERIGFHIADSSSADPAVVVLAVPEEER
jgi:hypothetical protein